MFQIPAILLRNTKSLTLTCDNLQQLAITRLRHFRISYLCSPKRIVQSCQRIVHARKRIVQLREMGGYKFIIIINNSKPIRSYVIKISIDPAAQPEGCR